MLTMYTISSLSRQKSKVSVLDSSFGARNSLDPSKSEQGRGFPALVEIREGFLTAHPRIHTILVPLYDLKFTFKFWYKSLAIACPVLILPR